MKIRKELKNATFEYDEEKKSFAIFTEHPSLRDVQNSVELNKVYAFAFMRFVIRMAQRNWLRKVKDKSANKTEKDQIELADHPWEDPAQMTLEDLDLNEAINLDKTPF